MTVDERARYELQRTLIELIGEEAAMTLMRHLPPAGWGDVATRSDLEGFEQRIGARFDRIEARQDRYEERLDGFEGRLGGFEDRLDRRLWQFVAVTIAAVFASALASAGIALTLSGAA